MLKTRGGVLGVTLALAVSVPARSQPGAKSAAPKKHAAPAVPSEEPPVSDDARAKGFDKASLEAYLKIRNERLKQIHQTRVDFGGQENARWNTFWNKLKEERTLFEVRMIRQRLDLFESLSSLESKDHPVPITDFEKLQANVIKAFEAQQKQKMADFFAQRDSRSREFAALQEKDRLEAIADAENSWQQQKASLRTTGGTAASSAASAAD